MKERIAMLFAGVMIAACSSEPATSPTRTEGGPQLAPGGGSGAVVVSGSGQVNVSSPTQTEWRTFSFHAKVDKDGTTSGSFELHARQGEPDVAFHGNVLCVGVTGNRAWLVGQVTSSDLTPPPVVVGRYSFWQVKDNGEGANAAPDEISAMAVGILPAPLSYCTVKPDSPPLFPIDAGNIQIH
jgi:hypothetical protein